LLRRHESASRTLRNGLLALQTALDAATQVLVTSIIILYSSALSRVIWSFFEKNPQQRCKHILDGCLLCVRGLVMFSFRDFLLGVLLTSTIGLCAYIYRGPDVILIKVPVPVPVEGGRLDLPGIR
jgi:hypothetical protein